VQEYLADKCGAWLQIRAPRKTWKITWPSMRRRFKSVMAEDCGQLMMLQVSRSIPSDVRQPVKNLAESSLLRKDVVSVVVPELPFLSSLRKVIGEAAYPLFLGGVGDIRLVLLLLCIRNAVFARHCAFSSNSFKAFAMPKLIKERSLRCD
jgi:hypothetical protein